MDKRRTPAVGIDPGGRDTAIVVRAGGGVLFVEVLTRAGTDPIPDVVYLNRVVDAVGEAVTAAEVAAGDGWTPLVGVEAVEAPGGYARGARSGDRTPIDPKALIGLSMVFGAVLTVFPYAVVVPRGGNGSAPLRSYPPELVGGAHNPRWPHAEPKGTGVLRHARSAFDVAGAAPPLAALARRVKAASAG